jgi:hypothetical protein
LDFSARCDPWFDHVVGFVVDDAAKLEIIGHKQYY